MFGGIASQFWYRARFFRIQKKKSNRSRAGMDVLMEEGNFLAVPIIEPRVLGILNKQYVICCGRLASSYSLFLTFIGPCILRIF